MKRIMLLIIALIVAAAVAATLLLFLSMPVVLGSPFALIVMLAYPAIIAKRIRNEEQVLSEGLDGYVEYMERVGWRLVPFIW